jgi:hypothetical protein
LKHYASPAFWALYDTLPAEVRALADKNYEILKSDERHPSLHFKRIGPLWSVRVVGTIERLATMLTMAFSGSGSVPMRTTASLSANKQLQRTVTRRRGDAARAPFHYARASRFTRQRAAAELRR